MKNREVKSWLIDSIHLFRSEIIPDFFGMGGGGGDKSAKRNSAPLHPHPAKESTFTDTSTCVFKVDHPQEYPTSVKKKKR